MRRGDCRSSRGDRHLVVVADDFGRSSSVNDAVVTGFRQGVLTAASIMAGGEAFEEAVDLTAKNPGLSVGLHVTLSDGYPVLPSGDIPDILNSDGLFDESPARAGLAYWKSRKSVAEQIRAEVSAQFDRIEKAGIRATHVDCHHHLHVHPVLFPIIAKEAASRGVGWIRIPREPWSLVFGLHGSLLDGKAIFLRFIFGLLTSGNLRVARECGLKAADYVCGLSGTGKVGEDYLLAALPHARGEVNEIYLHPDTGSSRGRREIDALTSLRVRDRLEALGFRLLGFRELTTLSSSVGIVADSVVHAHG